MVVAGVYLMMLMPSNVPVVLVVVLLALNMVAQIDVKKNIAYSTSIHLVLMVLVSMMRMFSVVVVYIMLHGMIKGQLFQSSGYEIHGVGSQDLRKFNMRGGSILMLLAIFMLSALVGIVMVRSKEVVVLRIISLMVLVLIVVSMLYTLMYRRKLSVVSKVGESERYYVLLLMVLSMVVLEVNFMVWVSLLIFGVVLGVFYGNSIVTVV